LHVVTVFAAASHDAALLMAEPASHAAVEPAQRES